MADFASHNTAFAQGIQKQLVKRAKEVMHKSALNPRIAEEVLYDARRTPELANLGRSIYARSKNQSNPLMGLLMTGVAGYGQLRGLRSGRAALLNEVSGLRKGLHGFTPGSPEHNHLAQFIADKINSFRSGQTRQFAELGAKAEPRMNFLTRTLPAAGIGAAGVGAGAAIGNIGGTASEQQTMSQAPFANRMQYLLHPNNLPQRAPAQSPGDQTSSMTDTGTP